MIDCQSHQDLNIEHKTKHRKVLLWGNTLVSVIIKKYCGNSEKSKCITYQDLIRLHSAE